MYIVHVKKSRIDPLIGVRVWETVVTRDVDDLEFAIREADHYYEMSEGDHVTVSEKRKGKSPLGRYARYDIYEGQDR